MHRRFLSSVAPSVRARLWFLVAVVAVPAALLSGWLIFRSYLTERLAMERHLIENARAFSALIDAELRERMTIVQSLAGTHALSIGDLAGFRARAQGLVVRSGEWVTLVDAEGRELVNTRLPPDATLSRVAIAPEIAAMPDHALPYVSNLIVAHETPRHSVWVVARARIGNEGSGFVILALTPAALQASLMRDRLRDQRVIAVLDRNQIVVARSRAPEAFVGEQATSSIRQASAQASEGVTESVTLDGHPSIAAFSTSSESGWMMVVASHKSDLFDPAKQLLAIAMTVTGIVGAFVLGLAWWVNRATESVAQQLVTDTQALARGEHVAARRTGIVEADAVSRALAETSRELAARQAALAQARDDALAASRAKDEFLASLSHELRTPLNPVLLLASEAARDATHAPPLRELFVMIEKNVLHEARLIDDLLDVTRIGSGKLSLHRETLPFDLVVADAIESVRPRALEKRLELRVRLGATGERVSGDSVRLHQVFTNVLVNAVKFTPEGGIIMVVTSVDRATRRVRAEFSDSGIGMKADEVQRVFERFVQGDHTREGPRRRFGGLGLGLAISRSLVELHGGTIEATSPGPGRGSTFTIWLPLDEA